MSTLVIAEHDASGLKGAVLNVVSAALKLGGPIDVVIAGDDAEAAVKAAAMIPGVTRVIHVAGAQFTQPTAENIAAQVLALVTASHYSHVLAAATGFGKNAMPRVAAKLDVAQISDITAVVSADTFVRPIYAGNAFATVRSGDAIKIITVRPTAFDPAPATGGNAAVVETQGVAESGNARVTGQEITKSERPELAGARVVVSGGRGLGSGENFRMLEALADKLHAALGASRAAVDAGYVPNDYQVGQTGKIVAPELYIAVGISGAIQHLAGMKDSKVIVAINKDPDAPIFQLADYGLVGDLFEIVPQLTAAL
jgi:electron transfer flavoprotein alpha subunit